MTTAERLEQTNLFANKSFYNAQKDLPSSNAVGTPLAINGQTGQLIVNVAEGMARSTNLGANVLGITGSTANGIGGNGGYSFGKIS